MRVLKIGASWCSGCLVMRPRWQEIESEMPFLETEYLDYDENKEKLKAMGIKTETLPTFIFFDDDGNELQRFYGEVDKKDLIAKINEFTSWN